jgi:hypothetical protein
MSGNKKVHINFEYSEGESDISPEDRQLQVKIAQLNAKLQVDLAFIFGFLAGGISFSVFGYQLWFQNVQNLPFNQVFVAVSFFILSSISFVGAIFFIFKLAEISKNFEKLLP